MSMQRMFDEAKDGDYQDTSGRDAWLPSQTGSGLSRRNIQSGSQYDSPGSSNGTHSIAMPLKSGDMYDDVAFNTVTQPEPIVLFDNFDMTGCFNVGGFCRCVIGLPLCICSGFLILLFVYIVYRSALPSIIVNVFDALK